MTQVYHNQPRRILFLCTANSCRSQMAEGLLRALGDNTYQPLSAGTRASTVNPLAIRAMAELNIDISSHTSKSITDFDPATLDLVITVCSDADENCPVLPGVRILHQPFDDPPKLAANATTDEEALPHYRRVRDEIRTFIQSLIDNHNQQAASAQP